MHKDVHILPFFIFGTVLISAFALAVLSSLVIQKRRQIQSKFARQKLAFEYKQSLLNTRIDVREATLNMLAEELHDNITQALTGCYMEMNMAYSLAGLPEGKETIDSAKEHLLNIIRDVRLLSHSLATGMVEHRELHEAIQAELNRIQAFTHLKCVLESNSLIELPPDQRLLLFRVVQEALQNTLKYAVAQNVKVHIQDDGRHYYLLIEDDGIGFDTTAVLSGHSCGLVNIKDRVEKLNGSIKIISTRNIGTRIELEIPLILQDDANTSSYS